MALPSFSSLLQVTGNTVIWVFLASLVPFLVPLLAICSSLALIVVFPLGVGFVSLLVFRKLSSTILSPLKRFLPSWLSFSDPLGWLLPWRKNDAASIDRRRPAAEDSVKVEEVLDDGRVVALPAPPSPSSPSETSDVGSMPRSASSASSDDEEPSIEHHEFTEPPASPSEASDVVSTPGNAQSASLDEEPLYDHREFTEEPSFRGPTPTSEVESASGIPSTTSSFFSEADKQQQIARETPQDGEEEADNHQQIARETPQDGEEYADKQQLIAPETPQDGEEEADNLQQIARETPQDDEEEPSFYESTEELAPFEPDTHTLGERFEENSTPESRPILDPGSQALEYPEVAATEKTDSVSSFPAESGLQETTEAREVEDVSNPTTLQGTDQQFFASRSEDYPRSSGEFSAEDVFCECKPTSVDPDWEDEGASDREVEGMPGTEVPDSHIEQASELRHETSDVAQPIDVEPMDRGLLEHTEGSHAEGSQPTAAESITTVGDVSESGIESLKEKDKEELPGISAEDVSGECKPTSVHPDWEDEGTSSREVEGTPGTDVPDSHIEQASKLQHETSDVAQPIDVEPMDGGVLEHSEGSKPTAAESMTTFGGVPESGIESLEEKDKEGLPELSAEDVSSESKPTSVHPDWEGEGSSDRVVEGVPGTDVPDSHIEQASELRHETSDVAKPIDVEPMDHSLLEHTEGSQPTAAESITTFGDVSESGIESREEKDKEELPELSMEGESGECKPTSVHPDWDDEHMSDREVEGMPGTDVRDSHIEQAAELRHETSDVAQPIDVEPMDRSLLEHTEGSQPTAAERRTAFGGVSESGIESLKEKDKEELPELSAEDVSGESKPTSVHSDWEDDDMSGHGVEGMPGTDVPDSHNEQASELRHETSDVAQPNDIEPMDRSLKEHTEGSQPTAAGSRTAFGGVTGPGIEPLEEKNKEELPELSAEDASGESKPTSVHPDWEHEGTRSDREEGMPGTDVPDSHIEQASELQHETSDVAQPINVEPMDRSLLEHTEGSQPTAAGSRTTFGGVTEPGFESLEEKDKEELPELSAEDASGECKPISVHPAWEHEGTRSDLEVEGMPGTDVPDSHIEQASELQHETSDVAQPINVEPMARSLLDHTEGSQPTAAGSRTTFGGVTEPGIESLEEKYKEGLPEPSAEDASGECKPTSVHPDWEHEGMRSDRKVEGMPGTDVPGSHIEQASELRHATSDVAQPINAEPIDRSLLDHTEGSQPAAAESITTFGGDSESGIESLEEKDKEDKAPSEPGLEFAANRSSYANGEESYPGAEARAAELDIKSSEDETSRASLPTFDDVSESEIKSREEKDKEDNSEAKTSSHATSELEPAGKPSIKVRSSKEMNMWADIDAIKKIVGYRRDLHGDLVEQIRALYLYVGMEPSSLVVNADDLEKAWEELEVLKVVIGLK